MKSIFTEKTTTPTERDLKIALSNTHNTWKLIADYTRKLCPKVIEEWNFSGEKFGWSFRIKDHKRVIIYLLPRNKFFKVAFVFGPKATDQILESDISASIKTELMAAKQYAEGRGIRIEVKDPSNFEDIQKLIKIKISN